MSDIQTPMLMGDDRLEMLPAAGRPFRMGAPAALSRSDRQWLEDAVDAEEFGRRADYLFTAASQMYGGYAEMALAWMAAVAAWRGEDEGRAFAEAVLTRWNATREALAANLENALRTFAGCGPAAVEKFRAQAAAGQPTLVHPLVEALAEARDALKNRRALELYWDTARQLHDACVRLMWSCAAVSLIRYGQAAAERLQEDAVLSCSFIEPMWQPVGQLPADALAAILADHLRAHLCGPGRDGQVEIIEEKDRYRLLMDPCGSAGVIRRAAPRATLEEESFSEPSPLSWQVNGVPSFCSHCALNEQISMRRFGYPAWVTEFDPDASRPCGWTVYKRREDIPEKYFKRLGREK